MFEKVLKFHQTCCRHFIKLSYCIILCINSRFLHGKQISSLKHDLAHLKIPLEKIRSATNDFAYENRIYKWGNYKGQLSWSDDMIDICARRLDEIEREKEGEFWMEVSLLSSLKHKNVEILVII